MKRDVPGHPRRGGAGPGGPGLELRGGPASGPARRAGRCRAGRAPGRLRPHGRGARRPRPSHPGMGPGMGPGIGPGIGPGRPARGRRERRAPLREARAPPGQGQRRAPGAAPSGGGGGRVLRGAPIGTPIYKCYVSCTLNRQMQIRWEQ